MRKLLAAYMIALIVYGCESGTGPSDPGQGDCVAWFNGLGYTVDLYYPADGTLLSGAFVTGEAPNDIVLMDDGTMAIVNSLSASIIFVDPDSPGEVSGTVSLESGCNPYYACADGDLLYVSCLMDGCVRVVDTSTHSVTATFDGLPNASGIALASGRLFVSTQNYPDPSAEGTFVLDPVTGAISDTLPTPPNTLSLRYFPETGMIHASSTTYFDDGSISVIDPAVPAIVATIPTGGTPGLPCRQGDAFVAGDAFSSSDVFFYDEDGLIDTKDAGFGVTGVAASGDTLFMTSFASDVVLVMDATTWTPLDTLQAGHGPQGILIIPE